MKLFSFMSYNVINTGRRMLEELCPIQLFRLMQEEEVIDILYDFFEDTEIRNYIYNTFDSSVILTELVKGTSLLVVLLDLLDCFVAQEEYQNANICAELIEDFTLDY